MRFRLFVVGVVLVLAQAAAPLALARPVVFVSAESGGEVVVLDPVAGKVTESIKVGANPRGMKLSRDGRRLFVACAGASAPTAAGAGGATGADTTRDGGLVEIDTRTHKVVRTFAAGATPVAVDVTPDGRTAFVANESTAQVTFVDLKTGKVRGVATVGAQPSALALHPKGKVLFVVAHGSDEVYALDASKMKLVTRVNAGARPNDIVIAPRGDVGYVVDEQFPTVTVLDTEHPNFKETILLKGPGQTRMTSVLQSAVLSPEGTRLYVSGGNGRSLVAVDLVKKEAVAVVGNVGALVRGVGITKDGKTLFTANGSSNDVAVINLASGKVDARIPVGGSPWGLVVANVP